MWTVQLEEDENGELIMPLPTDLLAQMGWDVGDDLIWQEHNGTWSLKKVEDDETSNN